MIGGDPHGESVFGKKRARQAGAQRTLSFTDDRIAKLHSEAEGVGRNRPRILVPSSVICFPRKWEVERQLGKILSSIDFSL